MPNFLPVIEEIENLINESIPQIEEIEESSFGYVVRDNEVTGLSLYQKVITELPESILNLKYLKVLNLTSCYELKSLPDPLELDHLRSLVLGNCHTLAFIPENLPISLEFLVLSKCFSLTELPEIIDRLPNLTYLDLSYCKNLKQIPTNLELRYVRGLLTIKTVGCLAFKEEKKIKKKGTKTCHHCHAEIALKSEEDWFLEYEGKYFCEECAPDFEKIKRYEDDILAEKPYEDKDLAEIYEEVNDYSNYYDIMEGISNSSEKHRAFRNLLENIERTDKMKEIEGTAFMRKTVADLLTLVRNLSGFEKIEEKFKKEVPNSWDKHKAFLELLRTIRKANVMREIFGDLLTAVENMPDIKEKHKAFGTLLSEIKRTDLMDAFSERIEITFSKLLAAVDTMPNGFERYMIESLLDAIKGTNLMSEKFADLLTTVVKRDAFPTLLSAIKGTDLMCEKFADLLTVVETKPVSRNNIIWFSNLLSAIKGTNFIDIFSSRIETTLSNLMVNVETTLPPVEATRLFWALFNLAKNRNLPGFEKIEEKFKKEVEKHLLAGDIDVIRFLWFNYANPGSRRRELEELLNGLDFKGLSPRQAEVLLPILYIKNRDNIYYKRYIKKKLDAKVEKFKKDIISKFESELSRETYFWLNKELSSLLTLINRHRELSKHLIDEDFEEIFANLSKNQKFREGFMTALKRKTPFSFLYRLITTFCDRKIQEAIDLFNDIAVQTFNSGSLEQIAFVSRPEYQKFLDRSSLESVFTLSNENILNEIKNVFNTHQELQGKWSIRSGDNELNVQLAFIILKRLHQRGDKAAENMLIEYANELSKTGNESIKDFISNSHYLSESE